MIGWLRGRVLECGTESILLDVQGVGYEILASANTLAEVEARRGREVSLWIHTHIREDALQLFGFSSKNEKELFLSLLKVNGIGPRSAIGILSGSSVEGIIRLIEAGDVRGLTALPKVGKKTAEQIILSLRGKLVQTENEKLLRSSAVGEIQSALLHLGFKASQVENFVVSLPADISVEEG
ncbi:MAG: Holliday junction branch migration protein RuvA, partial [Bdellovibrionaceae bacterium]|nr:Holliday junction branch migration protein RuvA [Pseudobdellovibrionaceae bacterium]